MLRGGRATKRKRGAEMNIRKRVETEWIKIAIGLDSTSKTAIFLDTILKVLDFEPINIENEVVKVVFDTIKDDVQKEAEKQKSTSEKNSKNGSKGGNAKWEKERQTQANYKQADAPSPSPKEEATIFEAEQMEEFPFEDFYSVFPMHRNRTIAENCWSKMPNDVRKVAFEGAKKYAAYIEYRKQYEKNVKVMYPSTYLHQKRWEDEYEIPTDTNNQNASNYGSNNGKSYKEAEFERNARTIVENLQAAERGELAYLSPFNPPSGQH